VQTVGAVDQRRALIEVVKEPSIRRQCELLEISRTAYYYQPCPETEENLNLMRQPGDPAKLAAAIVKLAASSKPPVHLPLGNDTLAAYREKAANFEKEISEWHEVIIGTDHDDVANLK